MLHAASPLPRAGEGLSHQSGPSAFMRQHQQRSCGGRSPKRHGSRQSFGQLLSSLINNARVAVIDHAPELDRAASQRPFIVERRTITVHCGSKHVVGDEEIADAPLASRCFYVLQPCN
ncbi:MAG: hypothetical protein EOQ55_11150 [Mesorhizobium sp.]|uniref:hypothetical protein n=1 Tax=unclassified Mesorhizobium TaxID=325217 RepID=UPI000B07F531|nr:MULTISPECIES: hypothetical protein [unclassified Mesorhizobium]MDG4852810.1 hypothetical protein [Mesorhizobium sp. WSM4982]MDG4887119.1 hypothetical protein [Mesorhizobium sp. WSM4887]MDG4915902.1 hypothetical protein [Mesorhizobium sp. WSM4983]PBB43279.1 hypothetical protein CK222_10800 [Mesorhizobium sp. WSM3866]RUV06663.1 hypothetical protein EOA79_07900 [Mesorhizobium sp. M1A.F.Ca.IN.020.03.2.1]